MNKDYIIKKVIKKLSFNTNLEIDELRKEYEEGLKKHPLNKEVNKVKKLDKLTPENAIEYTKLLEEYHNFKVPKNPKTYKKDMDGTPVIYVELEGCSKSDWHPVWLDESKGHLYGEY